MPTRACCNPEGVLLYVGRMQLISITNRIKIRKKILTPNSHFFRSTQNSVNLWGRRNDAIDISFKLKTIKGPKGDWNP